MVEAELKEKLKEYNEIEDYYDLSKDKDVISFLDEDEKRNNPLKYDNIFLMGKGKKEREKNKARIATFNLPQGITCPGKTSICEGGCYQIRTENMLKGKGKDSLIVFSRKKNLLRTMQPEFSDKMVKRILRARPGKLPLIIRIHSSGDFYSANYLMKWMEIATKVRKVREDYLFVAYTKSAEILDTVIKNRRELKRIFVDSDLVPEQTGPYSFTDFNLHVIGSLMDDTPDPVRKVFKDLGIPCYIVDKDKRVDHVDCLAKPCAQCRICYPLKKDIRTILRT